MAERNKRRPKENGSETDCLKLDRGCKSAIKRAFRNKKPKDGWPEKGKEKGTND